MEHNHLLQSMLVEAWGRDNEFCLAWLDLANEFGSIPHFCIIRALQSSSLTEDQFPLIHGLYSGSVTDIRHAGGGVTRQSFWCGSHTGVPVVPYFVLFYYGVSALPHYCCKGLAQSIAVCRADHNPSVCGRSCSDWLVCGIFADITGRCVLRRLVGGLNLSL